MPYDKFRHNRKSLRLPGWDYTRPGRYFVTICVKGGVCYFGKIVNNKMMLNKYGLVVEKNWLHIEQSRKNVKLDEYVIMPNHLHGIIIITHRIKSPGAVHKPDSNMTKTGRSFRLQANSIGAIIGQFKSNVTKKIHKLLINEPVDFPYFTWHRNYDDRIIRTEKHLEIVRKYIRNNPKNWNDDENNPSNYKE
jgi:putative transposase